MFAEFFNFSQKLAAKLDTFGTTIHFLNYIFLHTVEKDTDHHCHAYSKM